MGKNFCLLKILCFIVFNINLLLGAEVPSNLQIFTSENFINNKQNFKQKSDEYIFWAKIFTTNNILSSYNLSLSKAMKKSDEADFKYLCELRIPPDFTKSEFEYFKQNKEELADCFMGLEIFVSEYSKYRLHTMSLKTNIINLPMRFMAVFKPYGAIIFVKTKR